MAARVIRLADCNADTRRLLLALARAAKSTPNK